MMQGADVVDVVEMIGKIQMKEPHTKRSTAKRRPTQLTSFEMIELTNIYNRLIAGEVISPSMVTKFFEISLDEVDEFYRQLQKICLMLCINDRSNIPEYEKKFEGKTKFKINLDEDKIDLAMLINDKNTALYKEYAQQTFDLTASNPSKLSELERDAGDLSKVISFFEYDESERVDTGVVIQSIEDYYKEINGTLVKMQTALKKGRGQGQMSKEMAEIDDHLKRQEQKMHDASDKKTQEMSNYGKKSSYGFKSRTNKW